VPTTDPAFTARLEAARAGDAVAWSHLYHELAPLVLGYLRAQHLSDAEDVAGEVMLEVVRDIGRFRGDAPALRSWVLSIAHHRLLDARRRAQRRPRTVREPEPEGPYATEEAGPEEAMLASDGLRRLAPALASLTEDQRTVLLLRVIGDLPIAEVARITGKRPGAVKQLQRRAAAAMRRTIDETSADPSSGARTVTTPGSGSSRDSGPVAERGNWPLIAIDGHVDGR
jgi:RNA polymerase sigma-70 factor (ECF subfamily)